MAKLLLLIIFLISLNVFTCQQGWNDWDPEAIAAINMTCDDTMCAPSCDNYAPPPYCPLKINNCSTGCVCMLLCVEPRVVCFQARDCLRKRWYLGRKKGLYI